MASTAHNRQGRIRNFCATLLHEVSAHSSTRTALGMAHAVQPEIRFLASVNANVSLLSSVLNMLPQNVVVFFFFYCQPKVVYDHKTNSKFGGLEPPRRENWRLPKNVVAPLKKSFVLSNCKKRNLYSFPYFNARSQHLTTK